MKKYVNGKYIDITLEDMKDLPQFTIKETLETRVDKLEKLLSKLLPILEKMGVKV